MVDAGQPGKAEPAPPDRRLPRFRYRPVRLVVIVLVLLAAGGIGLHFKSQADPGTEPVSFSSEPPQYINVYESNQDVRLKVAVTLGQGFYNVDYDRYGPVSLRAHGLTDFEERVDITATLAKPEAPGAILVTSSSAPLPASGDSLYGANPVTGTVSVFRLPSGGGSLGGVDRNAVWFQLTGGQGETWYGTAIFKSVPIIYQDNGSTFGHLPSVGAYSYLYPPSAVFEGEYSEATDKPAELFFSNPTSSAGANETQFYTPNSQASYTESVQQIVPALGDAQSAYMSPADDAGNDSDYLWQANGVDGVQPIFKAVDLDAADAQTQSAFYSGIAFGVAGSAVIALIQEIPAERRERRPAGAGGREQPQAG